MNALDFGIVMAAFAFLAVRSKMSTVYYLGGSLSAFGGYVLGVLLAPAASAHFSSSLGKASVSLALIAGLAAACGLGGALAGKRLRMQAIQSRWFKLDKLLAWPYKIMVVAVGVVLLTQTLVYIPLLGLQFEAQGSTILMVTRTLLPSTPLQTAARRIAPHQFNGMRLAYDQNPPSSAEVQDAGEFQNAVNKAAASVVKISGRGCTGISFGSGFVAAPGFVVTNAHVVSGGSSIYISDQRGSYPATPIVVDNNYDIAVLYSTFITAAPLRIARGHAPPGTSSVILGYPTGGNLRQTQGLVTAKSHTSSHNKLNGSNTITLRAASSHGNSGGPILNSRGDVIGVLDAAGGGDTIAVSSQVVRGLVQRATKQRTPSRTHLCAVPPQFY